MYPENVTGPELAFISSQWKPDPKFAAKTDTVTELLQTRIALLWTVPSSVVFTLNSIAGRLQSGSFPETHGQRAVSVWRTMVLLACATQNVSPSDAATAG